MDSEVIKWQAPTEVSAKEAKDFVERLTEGASVDDAARELGLTVRELLGRKEVRQWLEKVSPWYLWDPEVRRKALIAQMTELMATALEPKDQIAAARVLIKDPDMRFAQEETTVIVQLSEEIRKLDPGKLWGEESLKPLPAEEHPIEKEEK